MTKEQLEHIIRASAAITGDHEFVIIGSQSILGSYSDPGEELTYSHEADIFSFKDPNIALVIDGAIGEQSHFHRTFGVYAHGVGEETATLPPGWRDRLVPLRSPATGGAVGLCLEVHDLAVSKLAAGRDKDLDYVKSLLTRELVTAGTVKERLESLAEPDRSRCLQRFNRLT
jgi:hypothetical protein